jgi:hypothetical protein
MATIPYANRERTGGCTEAPLDLLSLNETRDKSLLAVVQGLRVRARGPDFAENERKWVSGQRPLNTNNDIRITKQLVQTCGAEGSWVQIPPGPLPTTDQNVNYLSRPLTKKPDMRTFKQYNHKYPRLLDRKDEPVGGETPEPLPDRLVGPLDYRLEYLGSAPEAVRAKVDIYRIQHQRKGCPLTYHGLGRVHGHPGPIPLSYPEERSF